MLLLTKLLADLTIVEVSAFVAAPYAGLTLAQLGATVIRIDPIGGGLDYKRWPITSDGQSLYWTGLNKGKKSITIDLKVPEAQELAQELITRPGQDNGCLLTNLKAKGWLSFNSLKKRREDLIMIEISGNRSGSIAVDYTINARTGFPMVTGPSDHNGPVNHVLLMWYILTGASAANGLLVAERRRKFTNQSQHVKIALADTAFSTLSHLGYIAEIEINKDDRPRIGNHVYGSFACDFGTKDQRRIMITAFTKNHWLAVLKATNTEDIFYKFEIKNKTDLKLEENRYTFRTAIESTLGPWFKDKTLGEAAVELDSQGACWGPYQTFRQAVEEDPGLSTANPLIEEIYQPGIGNHRAAGSLIDFCNVTKESVKSAPNLGENTDEILADYLKLNEQQIGLLHDKGVVSGPKKKF